MSNSTIFFGAPGCGKTHTLMEVLSKELKNYNPDEIAFVSFTRKGAYEGRDRAMDEFGYKENDFPFFRTIHSLAFRDGGYSKYDMISRKDYKQFSDSMGMKFTGYYTEDLRHNDDRFLFMHSLKRNNINTYEKQLGDIDLRTLEMVSSNYDRYKEYRKVVDFDDIVDVFVKKATPLPVKVAIIDEAQDLTLMQWKFCEVAFRNCEKIFIGGDDDQAIYEWNGAAVDYFLSLDANHVVLHQSYRMRSKILHFARSISAKISHRVDKDFAPIEEGGEIIRHNTIDEIKIDKGESYYFLSRNNYFLQNHRRFLRDSHVVFHDKHDFSVDQKAIAAIHIFEHYRKSRKHQSDVDELIMKKYVKDDIDLSRPWFDNFNLDNDEMAYYRDLIKYKVDITKSDVMVNTIHGVKGGEADNVVLLMDVTRNVHNAIEHTPDSELRCLYVACTRAKKKLHIVHSQSKNGFESLIDKWS